MGKQIFGKVKRTMAILLAVLFVVTVTSINAASQNGNGQGSTPATQSVTPSGQEIQRPFRFLTADFSAFPTFGFAPLKVRFIDKSRGFPQITSRRWSFGDGTYSRARNPIHTYYRPGRYTVSLTVRNRFNQVRETKFRYIRVLPRHRTRI